MAGLTGRHWEEFAFCVQDPSSPRGASRVADGPDQFAVACGLETLPRFLPSSGHMFVVVVLMDRRDERGPVDHRRTVGVRRHDQPVVPHRSPDRKERNLSIQPFGKDEIVQAAFGMEHGVFFHLLLEQPLPARMMEVDFLEDRNIPSLADEQECGQLRPHLLHALEKALKEDHVGIDVGEDCVRSVRLCRLEELVDQRRPEFVSIDLRNMAGADLLGHLSNARLVAEQKDLRHRPEPSPASNGVLLNGADVTSKGLRHGEDRHGLFV